MAENTTTPQAAVNFPISLQAGASNNQPATFDLSGRVEPPTANPTKNSAKDASSTKTKFVHSHLSKKP